MSRLREVAHLTVRQNRTKSGTIYLNYTNNRGKRVRENLRLYLLPATAPNASVLNENAWRMAEAIKAERIMDIVSGRADIGTRRSDMLLADVLKQWIPTHDTENTIKCCQLMAKWLMRYAGASATLKEIDREFCVGFSECLRNDIGFKGKKKLNPSTARTLWQYFNACLGWVFRKGWIVENPCARLEYYERPHAGQSHREFLTIEELRRFISVAPTDDHYIRAYLFGCFCGLRWSDIKALRWANITNNEGRVVVRMIMQKTQEEIFLPLSENATKWLPQREGLADDARVFLIFSPMTAQVKLRSVATKAGIRKHLTFHTSRHTFATTLLTRGADLYTTSKLLGHKNIKTTQIYAQIVDQKKREAVDLLDGI